MVGDCRVPKEGEMQDSDREFCSEWMNDYRRSRRWIDARTVLASLDGGESLGKTRDVSVGGMRVEFNSIAPLVGRRLQIAVVFGDRVVDLAGTVLHRARSGDGSSVGLEFDQPLGQDTAAFLSHRYPPAMEGEDFGSPGRA